MTCELHNTLCEDFFLKSSRQEPMSLYQVSSDNPGKIIFTTSFRAFLKKVFDTLPQKV
jgi:hypothetical protein